MCSALRSEESSAVTRAKHAKPKLSASHNVFALDSGVRRNDDEAYCNIAARWRRCLLCFCMACSLAGCERAMHDMYSQPTYKPGSPSSLFVDGKAARRPPEGTLPIATGELAGPSSGRLGRVEAMTAPASSEANPYPITLTLLQRGRNRYDIYCAGCHGLAGEGDGMIVQRGFPRPLSYLDDRLMHASDAELAHAIADGYGVMYPFGDRLDVHDRWAIVAYIRALQLSQRAPVERLAPQDLKALGEGAR
jgi:mono/diheme cytochrome c family protein